MALGDKTKVMQHLLVMETVPKNHNSNGALPRLMEQHRTGNRMAGRMGGSQTLSLSATHGVGQNGTLQIQI